MQKVNSQDIAAPEQADIQTRRAYWHSRRGMAELEQRLLPFVMQRFADLPASERRAYERLLEHEDWDIFDWLQGRAAAPDAELAAIVARVNDG